ncbi:hypothetical protein Celaphus_00000011 [Cervus elaphus hippelaphus]|uniref:Uncharacterized protein n=1 Tax=Cervus elaphus hippelaphus TaxID=46360 RepID=A0A212D8N4_CEREH|nr:hypothetical protein Celaphus_00000011 [Cervus elaphus hippelaphus]
MEAAHVEQGLGACPAHVRRRRRCPPRTSTGEGSWVACTLAQCVWGGALTGMETEAEGRGKR